MESVHEINSKQALSELLKIIAFLHRKDIIPADRKILIAQARQMLDIYETNQ